MPYTNGFGGCSMRALVTGGAGFIGSHLIDRLVARGDEVDDPAGDVDPEQRAQAGEHHHDRLQLLRDAALPFLNSNRK